MQSFFPQLIDSSILTAECFGHLFNLNYTMDYGNVLVKAEREKIRKKVQLVLEVGMVLVF